jgi:hypothetical protein
MTKRNRKKHQDYRQEEQRKAEAPMTTESDHAPARHGENSAQNRHGKEQGAAPPHWVAFVEGGCAVMLVLITGTYTYYTAGQLHKLKRATEAAEGANKIAATALVETNRSWIEMKPPKEWLTASFKDAPTILKKLTKLEFMTQVVNIGKYPVKELDIRGKVLVAEAVQEPVFVYEGGGTASTKANILFPNEPMDFYMAETLPTNTVRELTPTLREELQSGSKYIMYYARGTFSDSFGKHWFQWCNATAFHYGNYNFYKCVQYNDAGDGQPPWN